MQWQTSHFLSSQGPCEHNPCFHGGTCHPVNGPFDFNCACQAGLQGNVVTCVSTYFPFQGTFIVGTFKKAWKRLGNLCTHRTYISFLFKTWQRDVFQFSYSITGKPLVASVLTIIGRHWIDQEKKHEDVQANISLRTPRYYGNLYGSQTSLIGHKVTKLVVRSMEVSVRFDCTTPLVLYSSQSLSLLIRTLS